jgi:tetratricopeptide (TPR) repeat protein
MVASAAIPRELQLAAEHHQAGRLDRATAMYEGILRRDPRQVDALHLLGLVAHQAGRTDEAIGLIRRALDLCPRFAAARNNLGNALKDLGQWDEAARCYRDAIAVEAGMPEAHCNLGWVLARLEREGDAEEAYRTAIRNRAGYAAAHYGLGNLLQRTGRLAEAVEQFEAALRAAPAHVEALLNLGTALRGLGRLDEAAAAVERAVVLKPDLAEAHNNLGALLHAAGRLEVAEQSLRRAIEARPGYPEAHFNLGLVLHDLGQAGAAEAEYREALRLDPSSSDVLDNLGNLLREERRLEEATACFAHALELAPRVGRIYSNVGNLLQDLGRPADALEAYEHALTLDPEFAEAHWNRGLLLLMFGRYEEGWAEYEWRWRVRRLRLPHMALGGGTWDGSPLEGRAILLHAEQGFGDLLQFARYVPMVAACGGRVLLECHPALERLMRLIPGVAATVPIGAPLPAYDVRAPLLSLPRIFGTTLSTIPSAVPYLRVPADVHVGPLPGGDELRVGIVWAGSPKPNPLRSCSLEALSPLFDMAGISWYSLQADDRALELATVPAAANIHDLRPRLADFAETAGLLGALDLVITIDTSVAHLAGALGIPVWVLLPAVADWRWLLERSDSPWYPSARLFRQTRPNDWTRVVQDVALALAARLAPADPKEFR